MIYICKLIGKWLIAKSNAITATTFGSITSIYAHIKLDILQINWGDWGVHLLAKVIEVGVVGAVGAFSGLLVKHLFEKLIIKKEVK